MIRAVTLLVAVTAGAAILSLRPIYEPDLWWHLAQGRENASRHLVRSNVFSFTYPDYRQQYTPWLSDTVGYLAWRALGGAGVQALQALCLAVTLLLLYLACRVRAPPWSAAAILFIGFVILEPRAIPRPHLVSFAGMAAAVLLVERAWARRSATPLLWAVPLVAAWSNLHVECVFGVLLIGIYAACELIRPSALDRQEALRAAGVAALCGLAVMANPYGWGLLGYLYENLSVPRMLVIAELRPPYLPDYRAFWVYVAAGGLLLLLLQPRTLTLGEVIAATTFAAAGARYLRLTPLVLLATAPMLAARLPALAARGIDRRAIVITAACAAIFLSRIPVRLLATELRVGTMAVAPPQFFSSEAVAFIESAGLEGPVFNSPNLGGYLAWTLHPRVRIFQDSRLQAYPPEHFRSILLAWRDQRAWDSLVSDVEWAVLSVPRPSQLSGDGRFPSDAWGVVFEDRAMQIVVRRDGRYAHLLPGKQGRKGQRKGQRAKGRRRKRGRGPRERRRRAVRGAKPPG
jgi:hypothetical protein